MRRLLILHFTPRPAAARLTTRQHLDALCAAGNADVFAYNAVHGAPSWLRHLRFDAVVLHTTLLCMRWNVWFPGWKRRLEWLGDADALKIAFPQDEYDHAGVLDGWLDELGVSVVCTVLDDTHRGDLYPRLSRSAAFYEVLTGYIDEASAERFRPRMRPLSERPLDVVYRARRLPYWYGSHGQLKHLIGDSVLEHAGAHGLRCDISSRPTETVLGDAWLEFLGTGRATIGTESGVSVLDRAGEVRDRIAALLREEPDLTFADVRDRLPAGWDDYRFFAISPRHLEAVVTGTAQILVEGRYSGVLEPGRHYIPVRRDFGDLDEALERVRDRRLLDRLTRQAYADVYESGRFGSSRLTKTLERILDDHAGAGRSGAPGSGYRAIRGLATIESHVERVAVAPVWNVTRVGRAGMREMLAGVRLLATDAALRRLLLDYLRSPGAREHVSPREALSNLLCLGALRAQASDGAGFSVSIELDDIRGRILLRSHRGAPPDDGAVTPDRLDALLRKSAVHVLWDHSRVGRSVEFPIVPGYSLRLSLPAGPQPLPVVDWLARGRPDRVARALDPLIGRRQS
jgi:hypothetical protein